MFFRPHFSLLIVAFTLSLPAADPNPLDLGTGLSLKHSYELALRKSESLKNKREEIRQSHARARAALGGAFPRLSWDWRDIRQDASGSVDGSFGSFFDKNQVESKFALQQPLFTGLKEFSAWSGFKKQEIRDQWRLRQAELQLFDDVARAFFDLMALETAFKDGESALTLAQDRVTELESFLKLGKTRQGELFSAASQAAALNAGQVHLRGQIRVARENLSFLLGQDIGSAPLGDTSTERPPQTLDVYLSQAAQRPDLEAQHQEVLGQTLRVRYEKGAYWPTANLAGNYYTRRPGFYEPIDWDLTLFLEVPLFQGGSVSARVSEARSVLEQAQQTLALLERQIQSDVRKAYVNWTASMEESQALEKAFRAAQKSYEAQRREYRLGLVTNLDVLNAMTLLQAAQRAWDDAKVESQRRWVTLIVSTGTLP